jgi:hypothetical protein
LADADWVARATAFAALAVSAGSAVLAWLNFRRSGSRVALEVTHLWQDRDPAGEPLERVAADSFRVVVTARNRGMGTVQIKHLRMKLVDQGPWYELGSSIVEGELPPLKLEGLHEVEWRLRALELARYMRQYSGGDIYHLTVVIQLGNGDNIESELIPVAPHFGGRFREACHTIRSKAAPDLSAWVDGSAPDNQQPGRSATDS